MTTKEKRDRIDRYACAIITGRLASDKSSFNLLEYRVNTIISESTAIAADFVFGLIEKYGPSGIPFGGD